MAARPGVTNAGLREPNQSDRTRSSAADLKFLQQSRRGSFRNFKSKSGTRIINLLVPLCFRSSCQRVLQCITNFGSGALGHTLQPLQRFADLGAPALRLLALLALALDHLLGCAGDEVGVGELGVD